MGARARVPMNPDGTEYILSGIGQAKVSEVNYQRNGSDYDNGFYVVAFTLYSTEWPVDSPNRVRELIGTLTQDGDGTPWHAMVIDPANIRAGFRGGRFRDMMLDAVDAAGDDPFKA